jgi:hypothetical protein
MQALRPTAVPVQVDLVCGWCAREVTHLDAVMVVATGKMQIAESPGRFRLLNGRPVCENCGGPLFVENWHAVRRDPAPDPRDKGDVAIIAA